MAEEKEDLKGAPPSEETPAVTEVPGDQPGKTEEAELDLDRALYDEDYLGAVNKKLAQPEEEAPVEKAEQAPPQEEKAEDDPVIDKVVFRGQEKEIRKSKQRELLQKGLLLDARLEELSPLIRLESEAPDIAAMLRTPDGIRALSEAVKKKKEVVDDDIPEVEGYDKDDLRAISQVVNKALEKRIGPQEQPKPADPDRAWKVQYGRNLLRNMDPEYEQVTSAINQILEDAKAQVDPKVYNEFVSTIDNPNVINRETGQPAYFHFYMDVKRHLQQEREKQKQATPKVQPADKPKQPSVRLEPGAATNPSRPTEKSWMDMPQAEFDRAFNEALARG